LRTACGTAAADTDAVLRVADGATPPIEAIAPIQNKVGAFLADPTLHRILTKSEQMLHLRKIMDDGQVLSVNLAKGELGEDTAALLGGLLITTIGLAAFSRAEISEAARRDFFLYIDEFQNFTTRSIANMTSELRKYRVAAVLAHQYVHQLEPEIRDAILGMSGRWFRSGSDRRMRSSSPRSFSRKSNPSIS